MSLYGMMRTGVSGMNAQANRLSTVADNIANSGTTGYKRASTEFSSMLLPTASGNYNSGGVNTNVRYSISQQGDLKYTTSTSDLAVNGEGFFVVQDSSGQTFLTRSGSFVPDSEGRLVNSAGFYLTGYSFENGTPSPVANGFGGLELVNIAADTMTVEPSTSGTFTANLPASEDIAAGYEQGTSLTVYDNLGRERLLDITFTKLADDPTDPTDNNRWNAEVVDRESGSVLQAVDLQFDANGRNPDVSTLTFNIPEGATGFTLDISNMTQLGDSFGTLAAQVNGSAPAGIDSIEFAADGTIYAQFDNGTFEALYRIPLATVTSPDQLSVLSGNVYAQSAESGNIQIGFPGEGGTGSVLSGALENSTVDIAEELTNMIESQRSYTANSKVFQTGSELMDVLVNLTR